jgi:anti-sigma B factor antagonist
VPHIQQDHNTSAGLQAMLVQRVFALAEAEDRPGQVPAAGVRSSTRGLDLAGHPLMKAGRGAITMTAVSDPPSATVVLDGEIDIATCPAARRFLMAAISGGNVQLAVDMSGVTFIDAAGIDVLVAAANRARATGGGLSLLAPSRQVRRLLDVFHLDAILPIAQRSGAPFVAGSPA